MSATLPLGTSSQLARPGTDGASIHVRGIPIGELASFTPRQAALVAVWGELPSMSAQKRFDAWLGSSDGSALAGALGELAQGEEELVGHASTERVRAAMREVVRLFYVMTIPVAALDVVEGEFNPAQELIEAATWLGELGARRGCATAECAVASTKSWLIARGPRLAGFGHPKVTGVDARMVAVHAFVMCGMADQPIVQLMHASAQLMPEAFAGVGRARDLANLFLPLAAALHGLDGDVARHATTLAKTSLATSAAVADAAIGALRARGE